MVEDRKTAVNINTGTKDIIPSQNRMKKIPINLSLFCFEM